MTKDSTESSAARNDIRRAWLGEDESALSPARVAKHRLTEQIRRLIDASFQLDVGDAGYTDPDPHLAHRITELTAQTQALADHLATLPRIPRATSPEGLPSSQARRHDALLCERSTINGRGNALSPPVTMWADGDLIRAQAFFTAPY